MNETAGTIVNVDVAETEGSASSAAVTACAPCAADGTENVHEKVPAGEVTTEGSPQKIGEESHSSEIAAFGGYPQPTAVSKVPAVAEEVETVRLGTTPEPPGAVWTPGSPVIGPAIGLGAGCWRPREPIDAPNRVERTTESKRRLIPKIANREAVPCLDWAFSAAFGRDASAGAVELAMRAATTVRYKNIPAKKSQF